MNNIAVIGAPGTGKSIISNSLSLIAGLPLVNEKKVVPDKHLLEGNIFFSNKRWIEAFEKCLGTFSSRVVNERILKESGFISDGSVFHEIILQMVQLAIQAKQVPWYTVTKKIQARRLGGEYAIMLHSLLNVAKTYASKSYDTIVWLIPTGVGLNTEQGEVIARYDEILESLFLQETEFSVCKYSAENYQVALKKMVMDLGIKPIYSPENALFMTQDHMLYKNEIFGMNSAIEKIVILKTKPQL